MKISSGIVFLTLGLMAGVASLQAAAPSLAEVARFHGEKGQSDALWLVRQDLTDPASAIVALMERRKSRLNYSLMQDGMQFCRDAAIYGRAHQDPRLVQAAATFADALLRKHVTPSGAFVEYDRNSWLKSSEMWRTIPWGTAFCGNRAFEAWTALKDDLTTEQRQFWRRSLEKTGEWIDHNPVVGGYVFNNVIDLCGLLRRIGHEFNHPEWCQWALQAAEHRVRRDIDEEGWIQGENGGVSGAYQLIGANYLARFAWEAKAPVLEEAVRRIFSRSALRYATPTLAWPGNFGTRSSDLRQLPGNFLLVAAAFGDPVAAYFVQTYGESAWSDDPALWRAALAQRAAAPVYPAVTHCKGIENTVVREGPWVAYFGNYDRSIWTRGFASLWHAGLDDWLFSALHSLPPETLSETERAKARVGDTNDWAGFPHVRISAGATTYDSHQRIRNLETATGAEGTTVTWSEPLLDERGEAGGEMRSVFRFHGPEIQMQLELHGLAGASQLDFHFMKRESGWINFWVGKQVQDILARRFVQDSGYGIYSDYTLKPDEQSLIGVQLNRTVLGFEVQEVPPGTAFKIIGYTESGLHSGRHGGFRLRIAVPATDKNYTVRLRLRANE